jgi:hypothetical protein
VQPTTSNPLENLAALVLGDDALNLQQEVIFCRVADRAVQEYHLGPSATKLLDQQYLVGVASCEPVRRVNIDALDMPGGHRIAQLLQRQPLKIHAAATVIHVAVVRLKLQPVSGNALLQRRDLTVNRVIARLRLARYTRVERDRVALAHVSPLRRFAVIDLTCGGLILSRPGVSRVRPTFGTRQA